MKRIIDWLPDRVDVRLRVIAWVYLVAQIVLVGTGGLVRLTSSGLGCPTWPRCTADSFVNTPEMGIHGVIEFGNRVLGAVVGIIAIVAFVAILRLRRERRDLFWLTLLAGLGIPAQAVLGGISVLSDLNPYVVGLHFVLSMVLVVLCTMFVHRVYTPAGPRVLAVPGWYAVLARITAGVVGLTVVVGILTTGSGPHAGDAKSPRNGLNPEILEHVHAIPAYATFALTVILVVVAWRLRLEPVRRFAAILLVVELVQIAVGLIQADTGLPGILVGVHMTLAAVLTAGMTAVILALTAPVVSGAADQDTGVSATGDARVV